MSSLLRTSLLLMAVMLVMLVSPKLASSQGVVFSGYLTDENGDPVVSGAVVVGAFDPSFDPLQYTCFYGDMYCNLDAGAYNSAVADGNFAFFGLAITNSSGFFIGSGAASGPAGEPIWLFAFEDTTFDSFYQVLASSTDPDWQVPGSGQSTIINAADANVFEMGGPSPNGVQLNVIPFPEPSSFALCLMSMAFFVRRTR